MASNSKSLSKEAAFLVSFSQVRLSQFHQPDGRCVKSLRRNRTVVKNSIVEVTIYQHILERGITCPRSFCPPSGEQRQREF
jgi:hypothetical protein